MSHDRLTVGSLFSGIGGIDLGLERAGMESRWFVEWDAHCQNVLRRHWPGLPVYGDITTVDWGTVEPVDVLAGGFPCQPVSVAGKQRGQSDDRWLWPEFARAIRALRPRFVLVENVRNLLAIDHGLAFAEILSDLAESGYDAEWDCIPASAVGAPHRRDRLWLLAYPNSERWNGWTGEQRTGWRGELENSSLVADPDGGGREVGRLEEPSGQQGERGSVTDGRREVRQQLDPSPVGDTYFAGSQGHRLLGECAREQSAWSDGEALPDGRFAPPGIPRVAHGVPHRVDRLRALGNAVVPQVVEWIGHRIVAFDAREELVDDAA